MKSESGLDVHIPRLSTERLLLRAFRSSDFADYAASMADPESTQFTSRLALNDRSTWWSFAALSGGWILSGAGWWAVEHRETGQTVGVVGVFVRENAPDFEIGWSIYRAFWRQGYGAEAAAAALRYAFDGHGAKRVVAHISRENLASVGVSRRLGMTYESDVELFGRPVGRYVVHRP